ncbi:MAG: phenylalanine--tRNA ligase subunit alpha [Leptospiraceae bacterium]|nr:phenylalanine--tRNA ligase subunit alpha [Leptospiraceae bacterium]MDW7975660.1 phenylalanine--tRNA ligase subunit alpha [Leptospiraceae bacterium]
MKLQLLESLKEIEVSTTSKLKTIQNLEELREIYQEVLGKKGKIPEILKNLKDLSLEEKREVGSFANELRDRLSEVFKQKQTELERSQLLSKIQQEYFDARRPLSSKVGNLHPLSQIQYEVEDIFLAMGFQIMDGPEVELDEYNFGKLNFTDDHPARDMQDTFWTTDGFLLRTHTSSVQVRAMEVLTPPFRVIVPGRVYRYEETDASHENTFYQLEGMMVDKDVSVAHLIYVMKTFLSTFFEKEVKVRLRPGFFPFVEPGFELDIQCLVCKGKGCPVCKYTGWVEILPCGLIHPNVLKAGKIDPNEWSGFAFGMGLSRLVMMRHSIEDIRHFLSGNIRFLEQF